MKSFHEVWSEISTKAQVLKQNKAPLYTLSDETRNFITDVQPDYIHRVSDRRRVQEGSDITKSMVLIAWNELARNGEVIAHKKTKSFTQALIARLVEGVYFETHPLRLFIDRHVERMKPYELPSKKIKNKFGSSSRYGGGGESKEHRSMKNLITQFPFQILGEKLTLLEKSIEFPFITGDQLDILMEDDKGRKVCIEVELEATRKSPVGFYQAMKYQVLIAATFDLPVSEVRTMVVAPVLEHEIAHSFKTKYKVESKIFTNPIMKRNG